MEVGSQVLRGDGDRGIFRRKCVHWVGHHLRVFGRNEDREVRKALEETRDAVDVVEVSVGEENCLGDPAFVFQRCDYAIGFLSGIDDKRFAFVFDD